MAKQTRTRMNNSHWLARAKEQAIREDGEHRAYDLFTPGSTAWRHFVDFDTEEQEERAIRNAQQQGYLSEHTGIPYITRKGYNALP